MGQERRASSRIRVKESRLAYAEEKLFMWRRPDLGKPMVILDVSHGGISFITPDYVQPGSKLRLTIVFVADPTQHDARGRVRYCMRMKETGMWRVGVEFTKKGEQLDRAIKFLVEKFV
jgi:hypothetical protein